MELVVGDKAPAFSLQDQEGKTHSLSQYNGQWVVLYFYPKDDTPGCTKEACSFRDNLPNFDGVNAVVLGVSADTVEKHAAFAEKYALSFSLLADPEKKVIEKYGVWQEKKNFGKVYFGIKRMTYLIGPDGKIAKIYKTVKPAEHGEKVLADITKLNS